ncbi:hypothetical protein PQX77_021893 [Marasmius sp. AFHP31]|nr:hypothetical protein PQX77_021893 [Marasmius sp. AFHP31]
MTRYELVLHLWHVLLLLHVSHAQLSITSPATVIVCQPVIIIWSGGFPPFLVTVQAGKELPSTIYDGRNNTTIWVAQFPPGTPVTCRVRDSTGASAETSLGVAQGESDTSCPAIPKSSTLKSIFSSTSGIPATDALVGPEIGLMSNYYSSTSIQSSLPVSNSSTDSQTTTTSLTRPATTPTRTQTGRNNPMSSNASPGERRKPSDVPMIIAIVLGITLGFSALVGCLILWHSCRRKLPVLDSDREKLSRLIIPYNMVRAAPSSRKEDPLRVIQTPGHSSSGYLRVDTEEDARDMRESPADQLHVATRPASDDMRRGESNRMDREEEESGPLGASSHGALEPPPSYRS